MRYWDPDGGTKNLTPADVSANSLPLAKTATLNAATGSLPAGAISGAEFVALISSNATPGAQLVRTAAQMLADLGATGNGGTGPAWMFRVINTGAGVFTLAADAGATVTLSGTMTVAQNTFRDFVIQFTSAIAATITSVGTGTYS